MTTIVIVIQRLKFDNRKNGVIITNMKLRGNPLGNVISFSENLLMKNVGAPTNLQQIVAILVASSLFILLEQWKL